MKNLKYKIRATTAKYWQKSNARSRVKSSPNDCSKAYLQALKDLYGNLKQCPCDEV